MVPSTSPHRSAHDVTHIPSCNRKHKHAQLCVRPIQVEHLYDMVNVSVDSPTQFYREAWDLRRLFTFSWRRSRDAQKRMQAPRVTQLVQATVFWGMLLLS